MWCACDHIETGEINVCIDNHVSGGGRRGESTLAETMSTAEKEVAAMVCPQQKQMSTAVQEVVIVHLQGPHQWQRRSLQ